MFKKEASDTREWHCGYQQLRPMMESYLSHASSANASILDIGCGTSLMGLEVFQDPTFNFDRLVLLDASSYAIEKLKSKLLDLDGSGKVEILQGDCRNVALPSSSIRVILDKGTCDALDDDGDKLAMIKECLRVLEPAGVLASVSFSSVARLNLLRNIEGMTMESWVGDGGDHKEGDGFKLRVHLIGQGDPARGHECRFLSLISRDFGTVPYNPDDLTRKVLTRIKATGSITQDDEPSLSQPSVFDLQEDL